MESLGKPFLDNLNTTKITKLNISGNKITSSGLIVFLNAIKNNQLLSNLNIDDNHF